MGLINLPEHLTEVREIFYLLDHWFIKKGSNSETARWNSIGSVCGKGLEASLLCPGAPLSPDLHVLTDPETLQAPPFQVF